MLNTVLENNSQFNRWVYRLRILKEDRHVSFGRNCAVDLICSLWFYGGRASIYILHGSVSRMKMLQDIFHFRHIINRRAEIWCRWQSREWSLNNRLAHGTMANTRRFWREGVMAFLRTWSTRKRPPIKTYDYEIFAIAVTHGIRLLLTEQKTCSYLLEFAHIRLVKEFADILKPQHLSHHNSFLYFFPNLFLPKSSLPKSIAQGHRRTLATVRYYPPGQTRLGHINTIQEVFLWLRFAWILTCWIYSRTGITPGWLYPSGDPSRNGTWSAT